MYGIGFERLLLRPENSSIFFLTFFKSELTALGTVLLVFVMSKTFLIPSMMGELMPVVAVLIFILLSVLLEAIITVITKQSASEFIAPFLCVVLALCESGDLLDALAIVFFAVSSYYFFIQLLYTIKKRLEFSSPRPPFTEDALLLVSTAVIMLVLFSFGSSWLLTGAKH
jgi:hypothetical protein